MRGNYFSYLIHKNGFNSREWNKSGRRHRYNQDLGRQKSEINFRDKK